MRNIEHMKGALHEKIEEAREIINKANREGRDLTHEEQRRLDDLQAVIKYREKEIEEEIELQEENARKAMPAGAYTGLKKDGELRIYNPGEEKRYVDDVIRKSRMIDGITLEELSLGRALRAMATGDWGKAQAEMRVMATAPDAAGGYLVPEPLSAQIIAMALNKMRVRQAGAKFTPMESKTLTVPRLEELPTPEWLAENQEGNFSDATFGAAVLTAKKLMVLTSMSIELAEDGQGVTGAVEQALADAIALEFDRVALMGDGGTAGEMPVGVANQVGVQELTHGGPLANYNPFSTAFYMLEAVNETATGLIMPPACFEALDQLTAVPDGQYLKPPASWENYRKFPTNQIPINLGAGENETIAFMGDWSKLLWGIRTEVRIEATRTTTDAFKKGQVWIRAYLRGDIALSRPAAFVKIAGIEVA